MDGHYFLCIFLSLKDWLLLITQENLYLTLVVSILADGFDICLKYTVTDIHFIILIKNTAQMCPFRKNFQVTVDNTQTLKLLSTRKLALLQLFR